MSVEEKGRGEGIITREERPAQASPRTSTMALNNSITQHDPASFMKTAAMPSHGLQTPIVPDGNSVSQHVQTHVNTGLRCEERALSDQVRLDGVRNDVSIYRDTERLSHAIQDLHLAGGKDQENTNASTDIQDDNPPPSHEILFEDDRTHLSDSSMKPASSDSKSTASVITFAMDEKDSLRPDDSASVQAIDESESLSEHASGATNSLTGSESDVQGVRDRLRDANSSRCPVILQSRAVTMSDDLRTNSAACPGSSANSFASPSHGLLQDSRNTHGFPLEPDEKLLEAMRSPKDRLLILQLEEKVRQFIQRSKEQSLELPPSNAFGRLLAHKLGDYYHLTHFVDNNVTSVRLHRTPFCRLPAPLSALYAVCDTPPQAMPTMKIMRRKGVERPPTEGSTAASSTHSKAASEAEDGNDGDRTGSSVGVTPVKDRLIQTREEREAKYNEARERIFRDFPESRSDNSGDQDDISRPNSTSGRKKAQRQKTPHDDSFEVRSQYNVYYPDVQYTNGCAPYPTAMNDSGFGPPFVVGPGATPPGIGYTASPQGHVYAGHMQGMSQCPITSPQMASAGLWLGGNISQQSQFMGYMPMGSQVVNQPPPGKLQPVLNNYGISNVMQCHQPMNWPSAPYQSTFVQQPHRTASSHWLGYTGQQPASGPTSYPYGQLSGQLLSPASQGNPHSLPGSLNRSLFNPQTRSFVPSGVHGTRYQNKGNQPGISYQSLPPGNPTQWVGPPEASGKSQDPPAYPSGSSYAGRGIPSNNRDSIAKWGTPSHLPPKPPPPEMPLDFTMKHRSPSLPGGAYSNVGSSKNGPLVVSGISGLPKAN